MSYKLGIICAVDTELASFIPLNSNCVISEKAMLKLYEGKIHEVTVLNKCYT